MSCNEIFSPAVANLFHPHTTPLAASSVNFILVRRNSSIAAPSLKSSFSSDGRITPLQVEGNTSKKENGRVVGVSGYSATEHYTLLLLMESTPDYFHSSESSPEWKAVYEKM
jgi:hypothetical protein